MARDHPSLSLLEGKGQQQSRQHRADKHAHTDYKHNKHQTNCWHYKEPRRHTKSISSAVSPRTNQKRTRKRTARNTRNTKNIEPAASSDTSHQSHQTQTTQTSPTHLSVQKKKKKKKKFTHSSRHLPRRLAWRLSGAHLQASPIPLKTRNFLSMNKESTFCRLAPIHFLVDKAKMSEHEWRSSATLSGFSILTAQSHCCDCWFEAINRSQIPLSQDAIGFATAKCFNHWSKPPHVKAKVLASRTQPKSMKLLTMAKMAKGSAKTLQVMNRSLAFDPSKRRNPTPFEGACVALLSLRDKGIDGFRI